MAHEIVAVGAALVGGDPESGVGIYLIGKVVADSNPPGGTLVSVVARAASVEQARLIRDALNAAEV